MTNQLPLIDQNGYMSIEAVNFSRDWNQINKALKDNDKHHPLQFKLIDINHRIWTETRANKLIIHFEDPSNEWQWTIMKKNNSDYRFKRTGSNEALVGDPSLVSNYFIDNILKPLCQNFPESVQSIVRDSSSSSQSSSSHVCEHKESITNKNMTFYEYSPIAPSARRLADEVYERYSEYLAGGLEAIEETNAKFLFKKYNALDKLSFFKENKIDLEDPKIVSKFVSFLSIEQLESLNSWTTSHFQWLLFNISMDCSKILLAIEAELKLKQARLDNN